MGTNYYFYSNYCLFYLIQYLILISSTKSLNGIGRKSLSLQQLSRVLIHFARSIAGSRDYKNIVYKSKLNHELLYE